MSEAQQAVSLVVGGSGGIGGAVLQRLSSAGERVLATYCSAHPLSEQPDGAYHWQHLDLSQEASIVLAAQEMAAVLEGSYLRRLLFCSGVLHSDQMAPEKQLANIDQQAMLVSMQVNAVGPLLLIRELLSFIPRERPSSISAISARVGSISDNELGGWYSYRCSKAALNMGLRTLSRELRRTHAQCVVSVYQPGTVATRLSAPYRGATPDKKLFRPGKAAENYLKLLDSLQPDDSGGFFDWAGKRVPY